MRGGSREVDDCTTRTGSLSGRAALQRSAIEGDVVAANDPADRGFAQGRPRRAGADLQCLRVGLDASRLAGQEDGVSHRNSSGLRFADDVDSRAQSRGGGIDQSGGYGGACRHCLYGRGPLPWRPEIDWVTALRETAPKEPAPPQRNAASKPSLPLAAYAGRYRDAWYGDVVIEESNGRLGISFTHTKQLTGALEHWQYDSFVARWKDRTLNADAFVTFELGPDGKIEAVKVKPVSPLTDFSFDFQDLELHPAP